MMTRNHLFAAAVTLLLAGFSAWLLPFGWQQRHLFYQDYTFSAAEARALRHYPEAMAAFGRQAWFALDPAGAADYFREAVTRDPARMEIWLKLAEAEAAAGRPDTARAMVAFVERRAGGVMFWQWPTALLAHDLGLEDVFRRCVSRLAERGWKLADTFNLPDTHFGGDARSTLDALTPAARPAYLEWLMRWGRMEDARLAWEAVASEGSLDETIRLKFVNFLISKKAVAEAGAIWHGPGGTGGMTNGGFEQAVSQAGFDWRWGRSPEGHWNVQQAIGQGRDHGTAARITFYGEENLAFHHFYQIVPVTPGTPHRLRWWWRGQGLTTDQGPFVEVVGYDCRRLRAAGPPLTGSRGWTPETLAFTPPEDCRAVMVRVRRTPSNRFDSKIAGTLWVDDFEIERASGASY